MSGLWASLKGQEGPKTAVVNDDLIEETDPVRGAPIRAPARRVEFKPVDPNMTLEMITDPIIEPMVEELTTMLEQDVSDLLAEDKEPAVHMKVGEVYQISKAPPKGVFGRPRVFENNAQRQKAYRLRRKFGDLL